MDKRDSELDQMLDTLRGDQPTEKELRRWQAATLAATRGNRRYVWPALAAGLIGVLLGAAGAWNAPRGEEPCLNSYSQKLAVENSEPGATFELTYVKLD